MNVEPGLVYRYKAVAIMMGLNNSIRASIVILLATFFFLVSGCKTTEVTDIEGGLAKEDQVIEDLQAKVDKRQAELGSAKRP